MGTCLHLILLSAVLVLVSPAAGLGNRVNQTSGTRGGKVFSLFSIVQFPNQACTSASSTTTFGTCFTSSECSTAGGTADGNCAAGFGVCCVISTATCGTTLSSNTSYVRNSGYPSSYTPTSTSTCVFTVNKVSADICQLRLDFQTFSGLATSTTAGDCTDYLTAAGQTGVNPPAICGTNTGYHMYTEFGNKEDDSITLTMTYGSTTTAKTYNILTRQISCNAAWKAPTDCVQYFTGKTGTITSYNFAGAQFLQAQYYSNCIRTEQGFCRIQYRETAGTTPDSFLIANGQTAGKDEVTGCPAGFLFIPNLSPDGITPLPIPDSAQEFRSISCGGAFAINGKTVSVQLTTAQHPFIVGVYTDTTTALTSPTTGFSLDYTQLAC